jgi:hypothetical protein
MAKAVVQIALLVTTPVTTIQPVMLVHMESIPITTFKPRWNRVRIVPTADILPRSVCPVHWVATLVPLGNIPPKKE